jgi:molybdenum storage protein
VKDVDGLYDRDPRLHSDASLIREIDSSELKKRNLERLPFERVLLDLLKNARQLKSFQIINGRHPERIAAALAGEHVGTIIHANEQTHD